MGYTLKVKKFRKCVFAKICLCNVGCVCGPELNGQTSQDASEDVQYLLELIVGEKTLELEGKSQLSVSYCPAKTWYILYNDECG